MSEEITRGRLMIALGNTVENHEADFGEVATKAICHHEPDIK